jgi:ABC-type glycerol-3-phosphate transport system substrate-binding protein
MRKRLSITISLLVLLSLLLASCSPAAIPSTEPGQPAADQPAADQPAADKPKEKITLNVEMSVYVEAPHKKAFDLLKAAYEAENPNVEIVYYGAPYAEFWDKLTTEIVAGTEADIVQLQDGSSRYSTYAALREGETGSFVNLDKWIKGSRWEDELMDQKNLTYNGHYIGLANYAWGARAVYYRKSLFEKAGIDPASIITTEDFLAAAKKLTIKGENGQPDQYGFGAVLSTHSFVWDEMKTFICRPIGGTFTPGNLPPYSSENITVNNEEMKWCWQWWQDMVFVSQVVPPGSYDKADERDLFWNGTVAMNIDGPWFVGMTREKDLSLLDDLGVIASPDVLYNGTSYPFHGEIYGITHLISSKSKNPEEAWKFLEWMAGEEAQKIIAVTGMIPSNISYATSDEYVALEPLNAELTSLATARYKMPASVDPNIPEMGEINKVLIDAAQAAFITGANVSVLLDTAADQIGNIFSQ